MRLPTPLVFAVLTLLTLCAADGGTVHPGTTAPAAHKANQVMTRWLKGRSTPTSMGKLYGGRMPVASVCDSVDLFGTRMKSQAKALCNATRLLAPPCVVVSIGSENIWDFERDIIRWGLTLI